MPNTRRILIVVGISLCAFVSTGCEPVGPASGSKPVGPGGFCEPVRPVSVKIGQVWLVDETYTPADKAVEARMNEIVPKMQFDGMAFEDVVQFLRKTGKVNIYVKWDALEQAGVTKNTKVSVDLTNVTFAKALRVILEKVGGVTPMGYLIDEGVVTISTGDDLSRYTFTRVYDVSDLIKPKPLDAMPPPFSREAVHQPVRTSQGSTNSGSGSGPAGWDDDDYDDNDDDYDYDDLEERTDDLMNIIRTAVEPASWRGGECGGDIGSVRAFDGKLVITQTKPVHRRIVRLLSAMRGQTPTLQARKKSASK